MPEITETKIRIPVSDCKITATIDISKKDGISALYCGEEKQVATYLFDAKKWTMDEAKTWVKEHIPTKAEKSWEVPIWKAEEERFVYGIVLQPDIVDAQGDSVSKEEIAKASHSFMENCQKIGLQHNVIVPQIKIWESYLAPVDMTIAGQPVSKGSWVLGVHVNDDGIWEQVRKGELTGFSIKGFASTRGT